MEKKLKDLLDFQRFAKNERISAMLDAAHAAGRTPLSDDTLEDLYAAGSPEELRREERKKPL